ncbi:uncharacterized protein [Triticum aestivum]|uniref:uncharacterized protein n=1 Tax=Triticum aestivum TaxID=4565 RepID=UPI001D01F223|nr:uncharacterized protein LOC123167875 [Triticum aestivum]
MAGGVEGEVRRKILALLKDAKASIQQIELLIGHTPKLDGPDAQRFGKRQREFEETEEEEEEEIPGEGCAGDWLDALNKEDLLEYVNGFDVGDTNQGSLVTQDADVGVRVEDASPMPLSFAHHGVHVLGGCPSTRTGCMYSNKLMLAGEEVLPEDAETQDGNEVLPEDTETDGGEVLPEDAETRDGNEVLPEDAQTDDGVELLLEDAQTDDGVELLLEDAQTDDDIELLPKDAQNDDGIELLLEDAQTEDGIELLTEDAQTDDGVELLPEDVETDDGEAALPEDGENDVSFVPDSMPGHGGDSLDESMMEEPVHVCMKQYKHA